jgi:Cu/Ag efflux protein CusF
MAGVDIDESIYGTLEATDQVYSENHQELWRTMSNNRQAKTNKTSKLTLRAGLMREMDMGRIKMRYAVNGSSDLEQHAKGDVTRTGGVP